MATRTETDLLGSRDIPADSCTGIHALRARENFRVTGTGVPAALVRALALVKKACCLANGELGYLSPEITDALSRACDEVAAGDFDAHFDVDALQGGAGTSTNMTMNELLANRALDLRGLPKGEYASIHPLGHVNLHQSTNDVYPTAVKIAAIAELRELSVAVASLQNAFQRKEQEFADILAIGRTELQAAVPMTLGSQFGASAEAFARDRWRTFKCEERLRLVNLGCTAVGTGLAAPRSYIFLVIEKLRQVTGFGVSRGENGIDQTANADAFAEVSGILTAFAANLLKICGDLRLLHLLGEIRLPAVQAGSSIMPGKVNPVILECAMQVGIKVRANDFIVDECVSRGSLQINEFLPLLATALLESLGMLRRTAAMLADHVSGIAADADRCLAYLDASPTVITAFLPEIGYDRARQLLAEYAAAGGGNLREFLAGHLGADLVARVLSPANLTSLGYRD